jgi:hypothetical protein
VLTSHDPDLVLSRVTLGYDCHEDRISLSGEAVENINICLWFTKRMMDGLILHLSHVLSESRHMGDGQQSLHHETAASERQTLDEPVICSSNSGGYLVREVDVSQRAAQITLRFRGELESDRAIFQLSVAQLPQWLGATKHCYELADWHNQHLTDTFSGTSTFLPLQSETTH